MTRNFYFEDVKKYLENKNATTCILDGFSIFADIAIIFTPIVFGPPFLSLLEVLDAKDRLFEAGKKLLSFIKSQTAPNYKDKMQQIDSAYVTLSLTAFVEALKENLPSDELKEVINYFKENKRFELSASKSEKDAFEKTKIVNIMFPNEVDSLDDVKESLRELYENTCNNIIDHFKKIVSKLNDDEKTSKQSKKMTQKIIKIISGLHQIPEKALNIYTAQLVDLMSSFDDFSAYIQLREFKSLRNKSEKLQLSYDVGLKSLANLIKSISKTQKEEEIEKICEDLKKYYKKEIEKPIASNGKNSDDELAGGVTTEDEHGDLTFPSIVDAYISQAYKCLRYTDSISLENPRVWEDLPLKENIGDFFVNYLSLPQSVEYPLIVLGLPGSGKSILTKILSSQLMNSAYTVVRIPLRDIDASNDIHVIISEQIAKFIQRPLKDGYAGFAENFANNPLFIIFDGYDELLQVKGDIFNGYISKIHEFQKAQSGLGRPVRVMITSRKQLIDKVKIPKNSVIVNLEAFDQQRRNAWIKIWNKYNNDYFVRNHIKPFSLKDEKDLSKNVKELAEQPLLLLMLALFDSYGNALESIGDNMSRTHLYDELLRRICRREANKLYTHTQGDIDSFVEKYVEGEMSRLGVVAIGMFNRKQLHIHTKDLLSDLHTYEIKNEWGEKPQEADTLIRSFFFVHKSAADNENETKKDYAYEFLHNTFGEFLTADFILNYLVREAGELFYAYKNRMQGNIVQKKLYDPNGIGKEWFINLMFAPLYSRPLVIEMIREHLPCVLNRFAFDNEAFQSSLVELVEAQLKMFLEEKDLPQILSNLDGFKDVKLPLIGHISTYTLNITILASLLLDKGFTFDERNYRNDSSQDSETSPWDKLINLWKTWFSSDNLTGLARIIRSSRNYEVINNQMLSIITLNCPSKIDDDESGLNEIEKQLSVANALSDQMTLSLCGLQTTRFTDITKKSAEELLSILKSVNQNLYVKYIVNLIRREMYHALECSEFMQINRLIKKTLYIDLFNEINLDLIIEYLSVIENVIDCHLVYIDIQFKILEFLLQNMRPTKPFDKHLDFNRKITTKLLYNLYEFSDFEKSDYFRHTIPHIIYNAELDAKTLFSLNINEMFLYNQVHNFYFNVSLAFDRHPLFLNDTNILEYMKTAPSLVSHYLLSISQQKQAQKNKEFTLMVQKYIECVLNYYENHSYYSEYKYNKSIHFNYYKISSQTLIYAIQIAANINDIESKNKACKMVLDTIHNSSYYEHILSLIIPSPELLKITIKYIPNFLDGLEYSFLERSIKYYTKRSYIPNYSIHFALGCINIIKNANLRYNMSKKKTKDLFLNVISSIIVDFVENNKNIRNILPVDEYENLLWFLENNKDRFEKS